MGSNAREDLQCRGSFFAASILALKLLTGSAWVMGKELEEVAQYTRGGGNCQPNFLYFPEAISKPSTMAGPFAARHGKCFVIGCCRVHCNNAQALRIKQIGAISKWLMANMYCAAI